jgi:hypothetical protein
MSRSISIINIEDGTEISVNDEFVSACWNPVHNTVIAAGAQDIFVLDGDSLSIISRTEVSNRHYISRIEPSHNGLLIVMLDRIGTAQLFNLEAGAVFEKFQDSTGGTKWTTACFDQDDEHIVFSSNLVAFCSLSIYSIMAGPVSTLVGPSEAVAQVLFHPVWPHIYSRGVGSIRIWTPTYLNDWSRFVPRFTAVTSNQVYKEPESEFDEEEGRMEEIECDAEIEVYEKVTEFLFESDAEFGEQFMYLPLDVDGLIKERLGVCE